MRQAILYRTSLLIVFKSFCAGDCLRLSSSTLHSLFPRRHLNDLGDGDTELRDVALAEISSSIKRICPESTEGKDGPCRG
jgi:hypothetical protein